MRLYGEIVKKINLAGGSEIFGYARCTLIFGSGGYFEGIRGLGDLSLDCVTLIVKGGQLFVEGEGLAVEKYIDGDVEISGKITSVILDDGRKKKGVENRLFFLKDREQNLSPTGGQTAVFSNGSPKDSGRGE